MKAASVDQQVAEDQQVKAGCDSISGLVKAGFSGGQVADLKVKANRLTAIFVALMALQANNFSEIISLKTLICQRVVSLLKASPGDRPAIIGMLDPLC